MQFVCLFLAAFACMFFGYSYAMKVHNDPPIGYIKFNVNNPAKEFLELHIMHDLDIDNPPKHVRLDVVVERGDTNGSISGQVFSRAKDDEHAGQKRY